VGGEQRRPLLDRELLRDVVLGVLVRPSRAGKDRGQACGSTRRWLGDNEDRPRRGPSRRPAVPCDFCTGRTRPRRGGAYTRVACRCRRPRSRGCAWSSSPTESEPSLHPRRPRPPCQSPPQTHQNPPRHLHQSPTYLRTPQPCEAVIQHPGSTTRTACCRPRCLPSPKDPPQILAEGL
jgi:hypothetical protein